VKAGVSPALVSQVDFLRSLASLTGASIPDTAAPDSENLLAAFLGESTNGRKVLVEQADSLAIREDLWRYIEPSEGPRLNANVNIELGADPGPQLYDLATDIGETKNLAAQFPDRVKSMAAKLEQIRRSPLPKAPKVAKPN